MTSVDFQSNLRKRIRKLPKFLKILKIIQSYSILFNLVLSGQRAGHRVAALAAEHGLGLPRAGLPVPRRGRRAAAGRRAAGLAKQC